MSYYIIDIETAPLSEDEQMKFAPEFTSAKTPGDAPEMMPEFRNGTLKDPAKIADWEASKKDAWIREQADKTHAYHADLQAKRDAWLDGSQLDAMRCRICAAGIYSPGGEPRLYLAESPEREIIAALWATLATGAQIAAHNIGYDLGILEQRSAILGIKHDSTRGANRSFYQARFVDTKELWKPKGASVNTPANLDAIGIAFGMGSKPGSGKDFWTYETAQQREYLTHDLIVCAEIVNRCGGGIIA